MDSSTIIGSFIILALLAFTAFILNTQIEDHRTARIESAKKLDDTFDRIFNLAVEAHKEEASKVCDKLGGLYVDRNKTSFCLFISPPIEMSKELRELYDNR